MAIPILYSENDRIPRIARKINQLRIQQYKTKILEDYAQVPVEKRVSSIGNLERYLETLERGSIHPIVRKALLAQIECCEKIVAENPLISNN